MPIKLIIGLGNPGSRYAATRHNVGFLVAEEVVRSLGGSSWEEVHHSLVSRLDLASPPATVVLAKPQTYMNRSGQAVAELAAAHSCTAEQILVIVDDIDLPLGRLRLRRSGGPGSHRGLRDIVAVIGPSFPRLRLGVRGSAQWHDLADYVTSPFTEEEQAEVTRMAGRATTAVEVVLRQGVGAAMNRFNRVESEAVPPQQPQNPEGRQVGFGKEPLMVKTIRFREHGGPEVLRCEDLSLPAPGPGEARIRHTAIGLNFIDTYHRSGLYEVPLPATPGIEAAGVVEEIGPGVGEVAVGDRVAYAGASPGAYSEARNIPADRLVVLPPGISDRQAAAAMVKGMTVQYLLRRTYRVEPGETILLHAAAGGVGLIACQWAAHLGATVIGSVGSEEKAELARAHGCHHAVNYRQQDWVSEVRELTGGRGVPVVYDSVGAATWQGSLDCLQPLGLMVSFGNASGAVPPFRPVELAAKGSLFLTRPTLMTYTASRQDLLACAAELFEVLEAGVVTVQARRTYRLQDAAEAHRDLEGRRTTGSSILLP